MSTSLWTSTSQSILSIMPISTKSVISYDLMLLIFAIFGSHAVNTLWWCCIQLCLLGCRPGTHPTNDISIEFKIQWKFCNALVHNIFSWSQWNFAHVMTVTLSWHVQNFIVISQARFKPEQCKVWSIFEFDQNTINGKRTWSTEHCLFSLYGLWKFGMKTVTSVLCSA